MGDQISKTIAQHVNEVVSYAGTGPVGLSKLIHRGLVLGSKRNIFMSAAAACVLLYVYANQERIPITRGQLVLITGCDTGIGYSFAQYACEKGYTVVAGFLNINSIGVKQLKELCGNNLHAIPLDITDIHSIEKAKLFVVQYLNERPTSTFHALVNNAGVMVFGEFEWQTERLIFQQLNVNLLGTMNVTQSFIPVLRKYRGRIITIGSHCAQASLPGLSVYGATKAALHAWCDALRIELSKFRIKVIKFIPGSFIQKSNIMGRLKSDKKEMESKMSGEQRELYKNYFQTYYGYLNMIPTPTDIVKINDPCLYAEFESALTTYKPKALYKNESVHYGIYHFLFRFMPTNLRDYFVMRFVKTPAWSAKDEID